MALTKNRKLIIILILTIVVVASFFRLWQLDSIPPGLYPDEAINGNEAISNPGKIFYPDNNGREGLFINLLYLSFSIFGISIWSLKIVPAIIGILTVIGLYLLVKEVLKPLAQSTLKINPELIALLSSFFLATSFWHTNFSRIGFRAILVPFILVFSFYFLFRGFRTQKTLNFILAGIFFGLGFYTYISFRVAVSLLFIVLLCWWFIYRKEQLQKKYLFLVSCFLFLILIVALPIGIYFLQNPQDFIDRAGPISIFAQDSNPPVSQIKALGESLIKHLGMFNIYGDPNWRHNLSGSPVLFWPVGILFLIGIFYSFYQIFKPPQGLPLPHRSTFLVFGFLIGWWLIMLLPGILTYEGIPHSLRSIGAIPPAFIFSALGLNFLFQEINKKIKIKKGSVNFWLIIFFSILLLTTFIFTQYYRYFVIWGKSSEVENAFSKNYVEIGNYLNSLSPEIQKYVIVNELGAPLYGISIPAQTPMFIERTEYNQPRSAYIRAENLEKIEIGQKKTVIIPLYGGEIFNELQKKFPEGKIQKENGFWTFKCNF